MAGEKCPDVLPQDRHLTPSRVVGRLVGMESQDREVPPVFLDLKEPEGIREIQVLKVPSVPEATAELSSYRVPLDPQVAPDPPDPYSSLLPAPRPLVHHR